MVERLRQKRQFTEAEKKQIVKAMIRGYKKMASINSSLAEGKIFNEDEAN